MSLTTRLLAPTLAAALVAVGLVAAGPVSTASAAGQPAASQVTAQATAPATGRYTPVNTARVFSSNVSTSTVSVPIAGHGGVASNATAVVVNVEVSSPTGTGYVRVTPGGVTASVATQEFTKGVTVSNLATVKLTGGRIDVKLSAGSAKIFMDVAGYYSDNATASTYSPLANFRLFGKAVGTSPVRVPVAGVHGIPSNATAIAVNTEVSNPTAAGYVRVTPAGQDPAVAAQVFSRGQTISNLVISKLSGGAAQVKLSAGSATVFMDVAGYYSPSSTGSVFVPLNTVRAFTGSVATAPKQIRLAGVNGVPGSATAVMVNAEVENPTSAGYVRLTPGGTDATVATQVFRARQTISNLAIAKVSNSAIQAKVSAGSATMFLDVAGYFLDGSSGSGVGNDISWPQSTGPYPTNQAFGIVGVNQSLGNTTNQYFAQQLAWAQSSAGGTAQPKAQLYAIAANPGKASASVWPTSNQYPAGTSTTKPNPYAQCDGSDSLACGWMYGYARAYDDVNIRSVPAPASSFRWWLDVETEFSWQYSNQPQNVAVLEGMTAYLQSQGVSVGLYSNTSQWAQIAGTVKSTSSLSTLPNWIPLGPSTLANAQAACSGKPLMRGTISMTQWVAGNFDYDNSCR